MTAVIFVLGKADSLYAEETKRSSVEVTLSLLLVCSPSSPMRVPHGESSRASCGKFLQATYYTTAPNCATSRPLRSICSAQEPWAGANMSDLWDISPDL